MENINNTPVIEPENSLRPKKKFGKPEVFMFLALLLGKSISFISSSGLFSLLYFTAVDMFMKNSAPSPLVSNFIVITGNEIFSFWGTVLSIAIYVLFAIFAYKNKLHKSLRFFGVIFLSCQITDLIFILMSSVAGIVSVYAEGLAYAVITLVFSLGFIAVGAAIGVIMLMVVEGKITSKKKEKSVTENINSVQEPENTVKTKKKKFGKPEVFMLLTVVIAQFVIPMITDLLGTVFALVGGRFFKPEEDAYSIYSNITGSVSSLLSAVLILTVCVLFAVFAYKNRSIKDASLFLGVFFAAQSTSQVFITKPIGFIFDIILNVKDLFYDKMDLNLYGVITIISNIISASAAFITVICATAVTAVVAVIVLMIVSGKFRKKKKKEEAEAIETAEAPTN